jgi:hypothetical protein
MAPRAAATRPPGSHCLEELQILAKVSFREKQARVTFDEERAGRPLRGWTLDEQHGRSRCLGYWSGNGAAPRSHIAEFGHGLYDEANFVGRMGPGGLPRLTGL